MRVVRREALQIAGERLAFEEVDAGIDFPDVAMHLVRIFCFDDFDHGAVRIAHDASVQAGIIEIHRQQRQRVFRATMLLDETPQRFRPRQRHVAGENQNLFCGDLTDGLLHGVPGAELLLLYRVACAIADVLLNGLALMSDDHHRRRIADLPREVDDVIDERPPRCAMEDLHCARLHAGAEARGHDDDLKVGAHCSLRIRSRVRP